MPKHYRPPGKKKEGNAAKFVTRSQAVKYLQVSLPVFRRLCILKGIFPREPKKKVKGNHHTYYHSKDILFLRHEPLLQKFRDIRSYDKKVKKAVSKKNKDLAERLLSRKPSYTLDRLIRERYPGFVDALRDLDDCLTMVHLFAALPAIERDKIDVKRIHRCRRLSHEWQAFISRTHKLRKTFISVKGIYYQAEVEGQKITWLTPHALQQVVPEDVDYNVMLTFLEFYETLLAFVNFKLFNLVNVNYPPILDPRLEALAADLYALSRVLDACSKPMTLENQPSEKREKGREMDESELRLAQLQHQLPSNEPGALMNLVENASGEEDEDDLETKECKSLFKNVKFFLSREVPRESLLFVIPAFGGVVSWEGEGAPFNESDDTITHQIVDRPTQGKRFLSREYVQPQWIYDCVNARIILPVENYLVGRVPPPHLSPFVDNEAEGYIPEYATAIKKLKDAANKKQQVLPMPGVGPEDDSENMILEGRISRTEAIEAEQRKKKMLALEKQYLGELKNEMQGISNLNKQKNISEVVTEPEEEEEAQPNFKQVEDDVANLDKVGMSRRKRRLYEAMLMGKEKKQDSINTLKKKKKKMDDEEKNRSYISD